MVERWWVKVAKVKVVDVKAAGVNEVEPKAVEVEAAEAPLQKVELRSYSAFGDYANRPREITRYRGEKR